MSKALKPKKEKIPKITEAEYAKYISSLKNESVQVAEREEQPQPIESVIKKG